MNIRNMAKKAWMLLLMLTVGFSLVWFLPDQAPMEPSRLSKQLPETFNGWKSEVREVSQKERNTLAEDTEFTRRFYYSPFEVRDHGFEVSVVFSGRDINNSLHRPEVCLRAQGWTFVSQRYMILKGVMPDGGGLPIKEIVYMQERKAKGGQNLSDGEGKPIYDKRVQYYTYIGRDKVVSGHYQRTWEDIKARLLKGYDQQWAYATFSTTVTSVYEEQGVWNTDYTSRDEEGTKNALHEFIKELLPYILDQKN